MLNLEKLGLLLFIKYVKQFDAVKQHLASSLRELLCAMSSTLEITDDMTRKGPLLKNATFLRSIFNRIEAILDHSIVSLESHTNQEGHLNESALKEQILESIIAVIDDEIDTITESAATNKSLKVEALDTVKTVLENQIKHTNLSEPSTKLHAINKAS